MEEGSVFARESCQPVGYKREECKKRKKSKKERERGKKRNLQVYRGEAACISLICTDLAFPTRYLPWKQQRCNTECDILTCLGPDPNFKPGVSCTMRSTSVTMHTKRDTQNVFLSTNWLSGGSSIHFHLQYNMYIYIYMEKQ